VDSRIAEESVIIPDNLILWVWGNYARFRLPKMGVLFLNALFGCKSREN